MAKLVWRVKLVTELQAGETTEVEVARIDRDQQASLSDLGLVRNWGCQCVPSIFAPVPGAEVGRGVDFEVGGSRGRGSLRGHHGDQQA
jgi:hypothetical protein